MDIDFIDLKTQHARLESRIRERVDLVFKHGQFIQGPEVKELEEKLAEYVGVKHAIGCSSGTDALLMTLMAYDVGPGEAIFTTPFTFIATAEVISLLGATPVFVDIDPETYNIDPMQLRKAVEALILNDASLHPLPRSSFTLRPRGVIAVDLYGVPAEYNELQKICSQYNLFLIEDAAQAFGAEYRGRKACSLADVATTSFYPAKPLGCYGDGGMIFTDDDNIAEICRSLLEHGKVPDRHDSVRVGLNARLDTIQAAILLAKIEIFQEELALRRQVASRYTKLLRTVKDLSTPRIPEGVSPNWALYTIRLPRDIRSKIQSRLRINGIPSVVYYSIPLHLQQVFRSLGYAEGSFPEAEAASLEVLSLPFSPYLTDAHQARIAHILKEILDPKPDGDHFKIVSGKEL